MGELIKTPSTTSSKKKKASGSKQSTETLRPRAMAKKSWGSKSTSAGTSEVDTLLVKMLESKLSLKDDSGTKISKLSTHWKIQLIILEVIGSRQQSFVLTLSASLQSPSSAS